MRVKIGDYVKISYDWRGKKGEVEGILQSVARVRSGAVLGFVRTPEGRIKTFPFSSRFSRVIFSKGR